MIKVDTIPFKEVYALLVEEFGITKGLKVIEGKHPLYYLRESVFFENMEVEKWGKLAFWDAFEYGSYEVSDLEILSLFYPNTTLENEPCVLITDDCFRIETAFGLANKNLFLQFIAEYDEQLKPFYEAKELRPPLVEFFQIQDYALLFPSVKRLVVIHHEGYHGIFKALR
ncbi:MAG: hypothetical protein ACKVTZ_08075 [Bacteroidia bacterium]